MFDISGNNYCAVFSTAKPQSLFACITQIIALKILNPLKRFRIVSVKNRYIGLHEYLTKN
jgi:hypothetical protein